MRSHFLLVGAAMGAVVLGCGGGHGAGAKGGAGGAGTGGGGIGGTAGSTGRGGDAGGGGGTTGGAGGTTGGAGGASAMGTGGAGGGTGGGSGTGGTGGGSGAGGATGGGGTGGGGAGTGGTAPVQALDMNDVTILAPLPQSTATPVLLRGSDLADDGTALVQRALVDHLTATPGLGLPSDIYDRLQLVAVRFDLCDRHLPGACPESEDARMRLVFQPLSDPSGAADVGFHAFYAIRNDEIAGALAALRDLAATAPPQTGALRVSPALTAANPEPYAAKLRAFVRRYGGDARAVRLTMNAQSFISEQLQWALRGVEKQGDAFVDMTIVGATDTRELVILGATASYLVTPMTDTPPGLLTVLNKLTFDPADAATQRNGLAALAAVENPLSQTAETVACVGCHVSTAVTQARASASIDPLTLPGRYTSKYDLSTSGGQSAQTPGTLRALGYLRTIPMISQRVANDTAQTLTEIEARYPAP